MIASVAMSVTKPLIARPTAEESSHRAHLSRHLSVANLRVQFDRTCPSQTYVRRRGNADKPCVGAFAALFDPGFHLGEVPDEVAGCRIEATGKFARRFIRLAWVAIIP